MKLFYTTPTSTGSIQNKPELSLGGFVSSSVIPNSSLSSLFSDISFNMIDNVNPEYIAIIFKNDSNQDLSSIKVWFEYSEDNISVFEVGAVDLINGQIQQIQNSTSSPYDVEFYEASGESNSVDIGSCESVGAIGLWLKRSLLIDKIKDQKTTTYLLNNFGKDVALKESVTINFKTFSTYGDSIGSLNI